MKIVIAILSLFAVSCSKKASSRIEIFPVSSFQYKIDTTSRPASTSLVNAVLAPVPLLSNLDIQSYSPGTHTFTTRQDMSTTLRSLDHTKALAVCLDGEIIYYIKVHPAYLSSISVGIATFDPFIYTDRKMQIGFIPVSTAGTTPAIDRRNDDRLIAALAATGRIK